MGCHGSSSKPISASNICERCPQGRDSGGASVPGKKTMVHSERQTPRDRFPVRDPGEYTGGTGILHPERWSEQTVSSCGPGSFELIRVLCPTRNRLDLRTVRSHQVALRSGSDNDWKSFIKTRDI